MIESSGYSVAPWFNIYCFDGVFVVSTPLTFARVVIHGGPGRHADVQVRISTIFAFFIIISPTQELAAGIVV